MRSNSTQFHEVTRRNPFTGSYRSILEVPVGCWNLGSESRMDQVETQIGVLRERMAHLEGLLEGLREAVTRHNVA